MCMLLSKSKSLATVPFLCNFYTRRFKRILPLYYLVILFSLIALYTVFLETAILQNQGAGFRALFFFSNRPETGEEDYFEKLLLAMDMFTHTWSLRFGGKLRYTYYGFLGALSLYYRHISPEDDAFNSMFARIWQFLVGMIVFLIYTNGRTPELMETVENGKYKKLVEETGFAKSDTETEKVNIPTNNSSLKYILLFPMACIVAYPIAFDPALLRPMFTVFTGVLMLLSVDDYYLSNRVLTYIGDISYALYLIHWPIYTYCKLMHPGNDYVLAAGLMSSILLAVLLFETYEKFYLSLLNISISLLIPALFVINYKLIKTDFTFDLMNPCNKYNFTSLDGVTKNMTYDDADCWNAYWDHSDLEANELKEPGCINRTPKQERWCDFEEKGGEFKIALFGNSLTMNHHKMFLQECRHRAYNVSMYSESACEPLVSWLAKKHCDRRLKDFVDFLKSSRPDYAFLFTRHISAGLPSPNSTNLETDYLYLQMRSQMRQLIPYVKKKLFVLDSFPRMNNVSYINVAKDLKRGRSVDEIHKELVNLNYYELARNRTESIVKECGSKCELIDYKPLLFNKTTNRFEFFDSNGFLYFTRINHMTPHAMELVRPIYTKICKELE
ncbi:hypothetical protein CRE_03335 [Caenorhabditis remanei]|uniref:SGNH domain-containing protein n=1 Tax=Caenorhabditis remanei TaxID=31234 RepID=E3MYN2_CAERE|nr:hypothetical protein CRE_03335 [Caenorhabditis remanei]